MPLFGGNDCRNLSGSTENEHSCKNIMKFYGLFLPIKRCLNEDIKNQKLIYRFLTVAALICFNLKVARGQIDVRKRPSITICQSVQPLRHITGSFYVILA